jgi:hypothetical protein
VEKAREIEVRERFPRDAEHLGAPEELVPENELDARVRREGEESGREESGESEERTRSAP